MNRKQLADKIRSQIEDNEFGPYLSLGEWHEVLAALRGQDARPLVEGLSKVRTVATTIAANCTKNSHIVKLVADIYGYCDEALAQHEAQIKAVGQGNERAGAEGKVEATSPQRGQQASDPAGSTPDAPAPTAPSTLAAQSDTPHEQASIRQQPVSTCSRVATERETSASAGPTIAPGPGASAPPVELPPPEATYQPTTDTPETDVIGILGAVPAPKLSEALRCIAETLALDPTEEGQHSEILLTQAANSLDALERRLRAARTNSHTFIAAVEQLAFEIPPPNQYTPRLVQLCNAMRAALKERSHE